MSVRTPKYRLHKPSGQAVVTLNGRDVYLGKHGTSESHVEYDRRISEWLTNGRQAPATSAGGGGSGPIVNELLVAYLRFADGYYRKNGQPTDEPANIRYALRPVKRPYGPAPAKDFGPLALKAVRGVMIEAGLCRTEINKRVGKVVRFFKWAVENELIPPSCHHGLKAVSGLRKGRSEARESEPVKPVPEAFVEAIQLHVARQVWAMVQLQRLTGMRPGEVTILRTCDLEMSNEPWIFIPESHKTEHHGRERRIPLGPRARAILKPWLRTESTAYLFSPADAEAERKAEMRRLRKTRVQPSQRNRGKRRPRKSPGERYDTDSYRRAIAYACKKANVLKWHPHQLRHNAATWLRRDFGLDMARAILGHSSPAVTQVYAEVDHAKAQSVMEQVG